MLHEALAEREHLLAESKKEKEVIVKQPSPMEKLKAFLSGICLTAIAVMLVRVSRKFRDNKSPN